MVDRYLDRAPIVLPDVPAEPPAANVAGDIAAGLGRECPQYPGRTFRRAGHVLTFADRAGRRYRVTVEQLPD